MKIPLNLNTRVYFKMKPRGVEIARAYYLQYTTFPNPIFPVDQPDVEVVLLFHELVRIFGGQHMEAHFDGSPIYDLFID